MAYEVETLAPRPGARPWATALTSYVQAVGPEFQTINGVKRWLNGITFRPFGCDHISGAAADICDDDRETTYGALPEWVAFKPFLAEVAVAVPVLCTELEELYGFVVAHSEVERSSILGAQVERAAYQPLNASLASEAEDVSGVDTSIAGAVYYVEQALADKLQGGSGMIHMPPGMFALFAAGGGVRYDAEGRPFTQTGHAIVADAGYLGVSPSTEAVVEGEVWIYGSGPVAAYVDPEVTVPGGLDIFEQPRNKWNVDAEQYMISYFDPCAVVAAVVETGDGDISEGSTGWSSETLTIDGTDEEVAAQTYYGYMFSNGSDDTLAVVRIYDGANDGGSPAAGSVLLDTVYLPANSAERVLYPGGFVLETGLYINVVEGAVDTDSFVRYA